MLDRLARFLVLSLLVLGLAVGAAACGNDDAGSRNSAPAADPAAEPIATVDVDEAFAAADSVEVLLVDVREKGEWDAGHAEKAIHIPLADVDSRLAEITDQAGDRPVWFICRSGNRSEQAARAARDGGVDDVVSVDGGMGAWVEAGHPIVPSGGTVI